jgi:AraC family transcriptional regulator of arabinose operon
MSAPAMARIRVLLSQIDPAQVSVGEVVYPPGGRLGPRWQRDLQLVLVHSGSARVTVDGGEPVTHGPGTVRLLLPGHREEFAFAAAERTHHSWVQARVAWADRFAELPVALPASTALTELVRAAVDAAGTPLPTGREVVAALAAGALWRYAGEAEGRRQGTAGMVDAARRHLHAHLADPGLDLRSLAAAVHVTPAHLVRRFRAELGTTPMAYLWQRRVATGIDLLTHTGLPVGEIARRTGFKSVYHFSRRVKQHAGLPPTAVRRAGWH